MLTRDHLILGLNALSRAHSMDYFMDGHRGAAMIAAYYLCQRDDMEPGAAQLIAERIDALWSGSPLCEAFPDEEPDPAFADRLARAMAATTDRLRQAGHNVIFPSLVLKAIGDVPEAATPSRLAGLLQLEQSFTASEDELSEEPVDLPDCADPPGFAAFALAEALRTMERFEGRGQGWTGHLLTHSQAVVDLWEAGHKDAAEHAHSGLALYVRRTRMGPGEGDRVIPEHGPAAATPLQERYWQTRGPETIGIGHCFKYPYAFYSLLDRVADADLRGRCVQEAYRVL